MSEEEEKCRLTYREGKRIAELAQEPFNKAKRALYWMMVVGFLFCAAVFAIDNAFPPEAPPEAIEAGFTEAQSDYIGEHIRSAIFCGSVLGFLLSILSSMVALTVLQGGITKGWLKAANEEEKE